MYVVQIGRSIDLKRKRLKEEEKTSVRKWGMSPNMRDKNPMGASWTEVRQSYGIHNASDAEQINDAGD